MSITIIPAIDLLDGRCVRLLHGDFDNCKVYDLDAARLAANYAAQGADWLHVVDLAASRDNRSRRGAASASRRTYNCDSTTAPAASWRAASA
jgi:phosphoribosylformimino-5-aminoimidazole carboxamide ribonucleotide (ProFAR) isomerase